jgi:hypothetical protein
MAWYKSSPQSTITKRGLAFAGDAFVDIDFHRLQFESSYRISLGGDFRVREGVPISCRYRFGTQADFLPSVMVGLKRSVLYAKKDDVEVALDRWGAEGGLAIEGPFERLSYRYCTALGGYHRAGLYLAFFNRGAVRMGTRYEYYHFENTDMVRVLFVWEGISDDGFTMNGWQTNLPRFDNRPWWHKGLAYVSVAPLLGIAEVLKLFGVH